MHYVRHHPISATLVGLYLLLCLVVGIYALTCTTTWCSLALVIPLSPWPQLEGLTGVNIPQLLLPIAVLFNIALLHYLGRGLEYLFITRK